MYDSLFLSSLVSNVCWATDRGVRKNNPHTNKKRLCLIIAILIVVITLNKFLIITLLYAYQLTRTAYFYMSIATTPST